MSATEQQATTPAATTDAAAPTDAGEAKSVLGQVWDSVATGVQSVAETIKHAAEGVLGTNTTEKAAETTEVVKEKAAELATTALEKTEGVRAAAGEYIEAGKEKAAELATTALEKTEGVRATAGEYIAAGTEKAAALGQQALDKVPDNVKQAAGEYYEAGKEKAAALGQQALDKVPDNVKQAAGEYYEAGKEKAAELLAAGQAKLAATDVPAAVEEAKEAVKEKKDDIVDYAKDTAAVNTAPLAPSQGEAKELLERTHGDSVDVTGHIVVAPEHKEGKASDYEGDWQKVGKDGHHNAGGPHIVADQ